MTRFGFPGRRAAAPRQRVLDGVPCRPYLAGQHSGAVSRTLLSRLVVAALLAAGLSIVLPVLVVVVTIGPQTTTSPTPALARWLGSPIAFGAMILVIDYLLIRGRLAQAISLLTWAGRRDLADLHAATGLMRVTDRATAERWLAAHPDPSGESAQLLGWRAHLQIIAADFHAAEATIQAIPAGSVEDTVRLDALRAQLALAQGLPFDAADLRRQVAALPEGDARAALAAEVAALVAQARWTCGGDHLGAVDWAIPLVAGRDRGTLLRGYWLPMGAMAIVTTAALTLISGT